MVHTVTLSLRPVRLAFLVKIDDEDALQQIFKLNTCLWGGVFNGIIPVFERTPKWWGDPKGRNPTALEIAAGYLSAFEPEYVVTDNAKLARGLDITKGRLISRKDVLDEANEWPINHGVDVTELYRYLYEKEFQFQRRHETPVVLPITNSRTDSLFTSCCFGAFPTESKLDYFRKVFKQVFEPQEVRVDSTNFFRLTNGPAGTPIRIGAGELEVFGGARRRDPALFLLDTRKPRDIIDYWNLRAMGARVRPVPTQWANDLAAECKAFVEKNCRPMRDNPSIMLGTTLICSRSVKESEAQTFYNLIRPPGDARLSLQRWYPRIWDNWARDKDQIDRSSVQAREETVDAFPEGQYIRFKSFAPAFVPRYGGRSKWINVVRLQSYGGGGESASVLPRNLKDIHHLFSSMGFDELSNSSEGLTSIVAHQDWTVRLQVPDGTTVFRTWFSQQGFSAQLSSSGKICLELLRAVKGPWGAWAFCNTELIQRLDKMAHGLVETPQTENDVSTRKPPVRGRTISQKEMVGFLSRINDANRQRAVRHLGFLTKHNVLRIGLTLSCETCGQSNWYPLDGLSERLRCERCLNEFAFPAIKPPKDDAWHYRTQGAFSVENYAHGGYTVALALRLLSDRGQQRATWAPGLEIKTDSGEQIEIDFALWWQGSAFWESHTPTLIVGEAKSFGSDSFTGRDVARLKWVAERFPSSVLVFATLRQKLSRQEKTKISQLARWGRMGTGADKWRAPVMVLTERELTSEFGIPSCWKDLGAPFSEIGHRSSGLPNKLYEICDATQRLYLDMEPYHEWLHRYWDKRHRRRRARTESTA